MIRRDLLIRLVEEAYARNQSSFERDILQQRQDELTLCGYELKEYAASVYSLASYFEANMELLDPAVRAQVFLPARRIYTKVRDCAPAQYGLHSSVSDSLVGDGAVNYPTFLPKLLASGYKGDLYIEREIEGEEQMRDILKTIRYVKSFLEG